MRAVDNAEMQCAVRRPQNIELTNSRRTKIYANNIDYRRKTIYLESVYNIHNTHEGRCDYALIIHINFLIVRCKVRFLLIN